MSSMEIMGWIGSTAFSICAVPQAWEAYQNKTCSINPLFLALWGIGEVFTLIYSIHIEAAPLIMNYILNGICLIIISYYNNRSE